MPMSRSTSRANRASTFAGIMPWSALGAGQIEKRLVDRQRLDQRRQRLHRLAHLAADPDIFRHVGPDHRGLRAQRQRLEHRHRRAHAEGAGDVAGRRDHAALAAADDDRPVGDLRIVALFDGGVERVAIDMGERRALAARGGATRRGEPQAPQRRAVKSRSARQSRQKQVGAAHRWRGCGSRHVALPVRVAQRLVRRGDVGRVRVPRRSRRPSRSRHRACTKSSTLARNCGSAAAVRRVSGPMPDSARNRPSRSGSEAMKDSA